MQKKVVYIALAFLVAFVTSFIGGEQTKADQSTERISGSDRLDTAIEISKNGWNSSKTVILARADHPADALAASSLVATTNAPILLTESNRLDSRILTEIKRLKAEKVYILGGTQAIGKNVEKSLKDAGISSVSRVSGSTRFNTASEINKEAGLNQKDTAILVNGMTVADALSASSVAANKQLPIYLATTNKLEVQLPSSIKKVIIIGGTAAISSSVESQLKKSGIEVKRISGNDRFVTSVNVAKWAGLSGSSNLLVRGTSIKSDAEDYPDAVAASGLAKQLKAPIILTRQDKTPDPIRNYISSSNKSTIVLGGTNAVSDTSVNQAVNNSSTIQYGTVINISSTLNVRNAQNGSVIGSLTNGAKVEIHETSGSWAKIRYGVDYGYVSLSYLRVSSTPPSTSVAGEVITIDPGHGAHDPGATANGAQEKEVVLDIALRVEAKLRAAGANVVMTRSDDTYVELEERANIANRAKASSFVSIHANAGPSSAHGAETYWLNSEETSEDSKKMAAAIQKHLIGELNTNDRGVKTANFSVLRNTDMPAALVETGFLTNEEEAKKMKADDFREKAAKGIYKGIIEYYQTK
jgi:N-acetylmuramoyl-L-alanine amidase